MITVFKTRASRRIQRYMAGAGIVMPLVKACMRDIVQVESTENPTAPDAPTILALTPERFRSDLEILANSGQFRVLKMTGNWPSRILNMFWPKGFEFDREVYHDPEGHGDVKLIQSRLRRFLARFLTALYRQVGVDCVIGAAVWYKQDYDWGLVSEQIGTPFIVLHLENLATAKGHFERLVHNTTQLNKFAGRHIVVHNTISRAAFIDSGFIEPDKIDALGCLRMDPYVETVKQTRFNGSHPPTDRRKRVIFFSFHRGTGLWGLTDKFPSNPDEGLARLFEHFHVAAAELARDNPELDVVVKLKWANRWVDAIKDVIRANGVEPDGLENFSILVDANVHEMILNSDVICGYGSTTLLEAGIAGKPVVFPMFGEALKPEYEEFVQFKDELDLFDVADSPESMKTIITDRLDNYEVDPERVRKYDLAFERHVSSMDGNALDKYIDILNRIIDESRVVQTAS